MPTFVVTLEAQLNLVYISLGQEADTAEEAGETARRDLRLADIRDQIYLSSVSVVNVKPE